MKIRILFVPLFAALLATGCGKTESTATSTAAAPAAPAAPVATPAKAAGPRVIELTANDTMKFNVTALEAKAGEDLKVVLTNIGTIPKEAMGHNFVLLKPGSDVAAFSAAAAMAKDKDYIPDALKDEVIVHTATLGPRKSDETPVFKLTPGEYPYLCSFPGHFVTMKGTLTVK